MSLLPLSQWSARDLAGQRLMIGFEGPVLNAAIRRRIQEIRPCGIILFATNIVSPPQVRKLLSQAQAVAAAEGMPPLLVAIDQEGGPVARLRGPRFAEFPPIATLTDAKAARDQALAMADQLLSLGIHMNYAPVLDVADATPQSIMQSRAFSGDAATVAAKGVAMINAFQERGIFAVAKHFPGIGRTLLDSHYHLPRLDAPLSLLEETDLIPFRKAMEAGVQGVMISHILFSGIDDRWPASLSVEIARNLLRKKMGYQGLVMTDDLDMKAIRIPMETAMDRIQEAAIDLALICHEGPGIPAAAKRLTELAGKPGQRQVFADCVKRILAVKKRMLF